MRLACDLGRHELAKVVESIQEILFLDEDDKGKEFWNSDKEWSGADVCERVAGLLDKHGLAPESCESN